MFNQLILKSKIARILGSFSLLALLFWGLLLIQLFGLQPLTGILAVALPYTGMLAKIYAEIRQEAQQQSKINLFRRSVLSRFFYADWPRIKPEFINYRLYRFECGLRSSGIYRAPYIGLSARICFYARPLRGSLRPATDFLWFDCNTSLVGENSDSGHYI